MAGHSSSTIASNMNLEELRRSAGLSDDQLARLAGVDVILIHVAERFNGVSIAATHAEKILSVRSDYHGRRILPLDVKGLKLC